MEQQIQLAIAAHHADPGRSISSVARQYGVTRYTLSRRLAGACSRLDRKSTQRRLTDAEEAALCGYIGRVDLPSIVARKEFVADAANAMLLARCGSEEFAPVGPLWAKRFLQRYEVDKETASTTERSTSCKVNLLQQIGWTRQKETPDEMRQRLEMYQRDGMLATLALHASARTLVAESDFLYHLLAGKGIFRPEINALLKENDKDASQGSTGGQGRASVLSSAKDKSQDSQQCTTA